MTFPRNQFHLLNDCLSSSGLWESGKLEELSKAPEEPSFPSPDNPRENGWEMGTVKS